MPSRRPATIVLRAEAASYADALVRSGEYVSVDDVLSDALAALGERRARAAETALLDRLRLAVAELDRGEGVLGAPDVVIGEIFEEALAQTRA